MLQRDQGGTCELLYYKAPPESHWCAQPPPRPRLGYADRTGAAAPLCACCGLTKPATVRHRELPAGTIRLGTLCKFNRLKNQRKGFPHGMRLDIADPSAKTAKYVIAGSSAAEIQGWVEASPRTRLPAAPAPRQAAHPQSAARCGAQAVETQLRKGRET